MDFMCAFARPKSRIFSAMPIFGISIPSIAAGIAIGILTVLLASCSPAKKRQKFRPWRQFREMLLTCNLYELRQILSF